MIPMFTHFTILVKPYDISDSYDYVMTQLISDFRILSDDCFNSKVYALYYLGKVKSNKRVTKSYYFETSIKILSINLTLNVNIWENWKFLKV